jgi:glycosyltransferase involved in cell wall biosynthesis
VRNVPVKSNIVFDKIENNEKIIIYQGAVNIGRGLRQAILAMNFIDGAKLIIAGDGDIKLQLEELVKTENLQNKVEFAGRLPINELAIRTPQADLGLSIEEDLGLNYRFALPNKLFDYIQANVPVLVSNLPEMAAVVNHYKIGEITDSLDPEYLAEKMKAVLYNTENRKVWKANLKAAANELVWEKEELVVREIFSVFLNQPTK